MSRRGSGTRWTTGCGHSWRWRHAVLTVGDLAGCATNCPRCEEMLIIPAGQFLGLPLDAPPPTVHAPLFHAWLNRQDPSWPADGAGTQSVGFSADD